MSAENLRLVTTARFKVYFEAQYPTVPIKYPNRPLIQPTNGPWLRFRINDGKGGQANLGIENVTERTTGFIQIDIIVPKDSGTKLQTEMADYAATVFNRTQLSLGNGSVTFKVAEKMPEVEMGETSVKPVRIAYYRDYRP